MLNSYHQGMERGKTAGDLGVQVPWVPRGIPICDTGDLKLMHSGQKICFFDKKNVNKRVKFRQNLLKKHIPMYFVLKKIYSQRTKTQLEPAI